tara:strand:- start:373 stop:636 length:264 start_codon:yes stop_codon:yes gene_type:complete
MVLLIIRKYYNKVLEFMNKLKNLIYKSDDSECPEDQASEEYQKLEDYPEEYSEEDKAEYPKDPEEDQDPEPQEYQVKNNDQDCLDDK